MATPTPPTRLLRRGIHRNGSHTVRGWRFLAYGPASIVDGVITMLTVGLVAPGLMEYCLGRVAKARKR